MTTALFCPECRAEYLASATTCADCDVPLVPEASLESAAAQALPPASELHCVRAAALGWARRLSDLLAEAGISHRIEVAQDDDDGSVRRPGANLPYGVYVRAEDLEAATEVDAEFMRSQIPDLDPDAGAAEAEDGDERCPACGAEVGADAGECPDCGLVLLG